MVKKKMETVLPYDFYIDKEQHTLFWRGWGEINDQDLEIMQGDIQSHPDFQCTLKQFNDLTAVEKLRITPGGLHRLMRNRISKRGNKLAIIVNSNWVYCLARMFQGLGDLTPLDIRFFRNANQARQWLGLIIDSSDDYTKIRNLSALPKP